MSIKIGNSPMLHILYWPISGALEDGALSFFRWCI